MVFIVWSPLISGPANTGSTPEPTAYSCRPSRNPTHSEGRRKGRGDAGPRMLEGDQLATRGREVGGGMAIAVPLDERGLRARAGPGAVARHADAPAIGAARGRKDLDSAEVRVERRFDVLGALNPMDQGRAGVEALAHRRRIEVEPARSARRGSL